MKSGETELDVLAGRLRARVAEGRYGEAQLPLQEYCRVLRKTAGGLPSGDPGLGRLEDDWRRLLEETRRRVLAGRAHAFVRLARLPKVLPLYREPCPPRHTWEYSG
jgi:hypothetical protein